MSRRRHLRSKPEDDMFRSIAVCAVAVAFFNAGVEIRADQVRVPLAVTMTNDPDANQINVYNAQTGALLQTLPTQGRGGAGGNAHGVRQFEGELFAAVNNGSGTVAIYKRDGNGLKFQQIVSTTSAPVSIDFG